jgi:hypothetical protein
LFSSILEGTNNAPFFVTPFWENSFRRFFPVYSMDIRLDTPPQSLGGHFRGLYCLSIDVVRAGDCADHSR